MTHKWLAILALSFGALTITACSDGDDDLDDAIEEAGDEIEDAADNAGDAAEDVVDDIDDET